MDEMKITEYQVMKSEKMGLNVAFLGFMFLSGLLLCTAQVPPSPLCPSHRPPSLVYDFVLMEANFTRNCTTKSMLTVNGMFPGPEIRVHKGETVTVTVHNNGTYGVTLHWHGVKQPRNPWHDGPEYITQCPIQPKSSFTQQIVFSDEIGTLWWHAHSDWSRATVHGAIVVLPENDTYPTGIKFDCEQTIVIGSWYDGDIVEEFEKANNHTEPDAADSYLINGYVGNYSNPCTNETTFNISVAYNMTYLLRMVNAVMNEEIFFSIANHSLRVIGMDGAYVAPIDTDYIVLGPGNTMDVLVTAEQKNGSYYMAVTHYSYGGPPATVATATAILQYNPPSTPVFPTDTLPESDNYTAAEAFRDQLKSTTVQNVPKDDIKRYYVTLSVFASQTDGTRNASLSDISFVSPSADYMLNSSLSCITSGDCGDIDLFPTEPNTNGTLIFGTKVILANLSDVVEIVFQGAENGAEDHPMHLHGHSFYLVGRRFNATFNESYDPDHYYNLEDPPLLNTAGVPYEGWTAIRFVADNPGAWFIHCHFERHTTWGMAMAVIVREGKTTKLRQRPGDMPVCLAT